MLPADAYRQLLLLIPIAFPDKNVYDMEGVGTRWNYDNPDADWGHVDSRCDGNRQSPIALTATSSLITPIRPLKFGNYDIPLQAPVVVRNNGHSADVALPPTTNGNRAFISGARLSDRYEAIGFHFHWGSSGIKGSEHSINNRRYDVEMHIVHRNSKYATTEEAINQKDGLAVLAVMINISNDPDRIYPGLNKVFNKLPEIINYQSSATINGPLSLGQLLGDLNTKQFYTYMGSLTTPPCAEAVTFIVFTDVLLVARAQIEKFFDLLDTDGQPLLENFRPIQRRNNRVVYYRLNSALG